RGRYPKCSPLNPGPFRSTVLLQIGRQYDLCILRIVAIQFTGIARAGRVVFISIRQVATILWPQKSHVTKTIYISTWHLHNHLFLSTAVPGCVFSWMWTGTNKRGSKDMISLSIDSPPDQLPCWSIATAAGTGRR